MTGQDKGKSGDRPQWRTIVAAAFPADRAPGELSVAIVSLVELCQLAMPNPSALREAIASAGFADGPQERADEFGKILSLDSKVFAFPVKNVRHQLYARERNEERVRLLISEGESANGPVVFVSTIFTGAIEADAIKAAAHVTRKNALTGTTATNANGVIVRRVFWDTQGESGVFGLMVTGPENLEAWEGVRAFTAFNLVNKKN